MLYKTLLAFCLLFPSYVLADISVESSYDPHDPIVASCEIEGVDPNDVIYEWSVNLKPDQYKSLNNNQCLHIWAPPGTYNMGCTAVMLSKLNVTILLRDPDDPGNITRAKMVDMDVIERIEVKRFTKSFTVAGLVPPTPSPTPTPGPVPPGPTPAPAPVPVPVGSV